jgi:hypothetical protein
MKILFKIPLILIALIYITCDFEKPPPVKNYCYINQHSLDTFFTSIIAVDTIYDDSKPDTLNNTYIDFYDMTISHRGYSFENASKIIRKNNYNTIYSRVIGITKSNKIFYVSPVTKTIRRKQ